MERVQKQVRLGSLVCLLILFSLMILLFSNGIKAEDSTGTVKQGWIRRDSKLILRSNGNTIQEFTLSETDLTQAMNATSQNSKKSILNSTGSVSDDGKYAWVDNKKYTFSPNGNQGNYSFRFYGPNGELLWERNDLVSTVVTSDGRIVLALSVNPKWIANMKYGESYAFPVIYDSSGSGNKIEGYGSFDNSWRLSKDGRYATIVCNKLPLNTIRVILQIIFSIQKNKLYYINLPGGIDIDDIDSNGRYKLIETEQEKNPSTGRYEFKTNIVGEGKLE